MGALRQPLGTKVRLCIDFKWLSQYMGSFDKNDDLLLKIWPQAIIRKLVG